MTCSVCGGTNPSDHRCCKECGARLDQAGDALAEQVLAILRRELRDQKVVELETSQAVLERVSAWAKLFGYFVAVPLALLIATLAIWGVSNFTDFKSKVDKAQEKIDQAQKKLNDADSQADKLKATGTQLEANYRQLQEDATRYQAVVQEVQSLRNDVSKLQERIGVTAGSAVSTQQRSLILNELSRFQKYFQRLGYAPAAGVVKVDVRDPSKMSAGTLAYFELETRTAVISKDVVDDISMILREYSHSVLYSKTPKQTGINETSPFVAIEWGLASYFPASFLGNAKVTQWNLDGDKSWKPDGKFWDNAEPAAAMIWAVRKQMTDKDGFDRKLLQAWFEVAPQYQDPKFTAIFTNRLVALVGAADGAQVKQIFASRGLPL